MRYNMQYKWTLPSPVPVLRWSSFLPYSYSRRITRQSWIRNGKPPPRESTRIIHSDLLWSVERSIPIPFSHWSISNVNMFWKFLEEVGSKEIVAEHTALDLKSFSNVNNVIGVRFNRPIPLLKIIVTSSWDESMESGCWITGDMR